MEAAQVALYDYVCPACRVETEVSHKIDRTEPVRCIVCGHPEMVKKIGGRVGFVLKGPDWSSRGRV
jgi:putative FmdB family regulatory protein